MGHLRFTLAILVLLSHAGLLIHGHNPGVVAVVVFYAISGYVMSALIERHYAGAPHTGRFYLDRLLRIYPQYAIYALVTLVWLYTIGQPTPFLQQQPHIQDGLNNLLIVPLNYYMYNGADRFTLIPPAWSLGTEVLFYALAPWLWRHWRIALALALLSLLTQATAWHGLIHTDWWGYRLMPGVLWVFVLGMALQRYQSSHPQRARRIAWGAPLGAAVVWAYLAGQGLHTQPYHREVLIGIGLGLPLIDLFSRKTANTPNLANPTPLQRIDQHLGDWSYGIFLNHFLIIWALGLAQPQNAAQWGQLILASIVLSAFTQNLVEKPLLHWRRQWRSPRPPAPSAQQNNL